MTDIDPGIRFPGESEEYRRERNRLLQAEAGLRAGDRTGRGETRSSSHGSAGGAGADFIRLAGRLEDAQPRRAGSRFCCHERPGRVDDRGAWRRDCRSWSASTHSGGRAHARTQRR